jgi:hypothetical protein
MTRPVPIALSPAQIPALRRISVAALLAPLLAACAAPEPLKPDYQRDDVRLHAHVYDDYPQLMRTCAGLMLHPELTVGACARHTVAHDTCEIFIPQPRHQTDDIVFAMIGHEVWHCLRGRFHDHPKPRKELP